jgi:hypothetical protein
VLFDPLPFGLVSGSEAIRQDNDIAFAANPYAPARLTIVAPRPFEFWTDMQKPLAVPIANVDGIAGLASAASTGNGPAHTSPTQCLPFVFLRFYW